MRFTVTREYGLPDEVKQECFKAQEDDIEVNQTSPTGHPMHTFQSGPGIGDGITPNCEAYGYLLDANTQPGTARWRPTRGRGLSWWPTRPACALTCATSRSGLAAPDGLAPEGHLGAARRRQLPAAEHLRDDQFSTGTHIALPAPEAVDPPARRRAAARHPTPAAPAATG